jgi:hypothetical protein
MKEFGRRLTFAAAAVAFAIGTLQWQPVAANEFRPSSCFQPSCPNLSAQIQAASSTMTADQLNDVTIVIRNSDGSQPATILAGTTVMRASFSSPVGYVRSSAPYDCGVEEDEFPGGVGGQSHLLVVPRGPVPQSQIDCVAIHDDTIVPGSTRAITLSISPPTAIGEPSRRSRLRLTAQLDPNGVIALDPDRSETVDSTFEVGPSALVRLAPDAGTLPPTANEFDPAASFQRSVVACSGVANVLLSQVEDFGAIRFSPAFGSMTCSISLHPADLQSGPLTVEPKTPVLVLDVDSLELHSVATRHGFSCFGATNYNEAMNFPRHSLKMYCVAKDRIVFEPGQDRPVVSFSAWMSSELDDIDWQFCPYPFAASHPEVANLTSGLACGSGFGGSAGD